MMPFLLMDRVGVNETVFHKALRRGRALRKFARQRRASDSDTVGQVGTSIAKGMTRAEVTEDLGLHLRDMAAWKLRAAQRQWERGTQQRL